MNILILAGIIIGFYYLNKRKAMPEPAMTLVAEEGPFPSVGYRPIVDFSTTTPVPIAIEDTYGQTIFRFSINAEWKNLDATWDLLIFKIGEEVIATLHPRVVSGRQTIPVQVKAVPGGQRQVAMIAKNVQGIEHIKAAAYEMISFGVVV